MKTIFHDGYIITSHKGNTYLGETAQKLMHEAEKTSREFNKDFQTILCGYIKAYKKQMLKLGYKV